MPFPTKAHYVVRGTTTAASAGKVSGGWSSGAAAAAAVPSLPDHATATGARGSLALPASRDPYWRSLSASTSSTDLNAGLHPFVTDRSREGVGSASSGGGLPMNSKASAIVAALARPPTAGASSTSSGGNISATDVGSSASTLPSTASAYTTSAYATAQQEGKSLVDRLRQELSAIRMASHAAAASSAVTSGAAAGGGDGRGSMPGFVPDPFQQSSFKSKRGRITVVHDDDADGVEENGSDGEGGGGFGEVSEMAGSGGASARPKRSRKSTSGTSGLSYASAPASLSPFALVSPSTSSLATMTSVAGNHPGGVYAPQGKALPSDVSRVLMSWFLAHMDAPYPSPDEKKQLMAATGLNHTQLRNWLTNQRKRHWKPVVSGGRQPRSQLELVLATANMAHDGTAPVLSLPSPTTASMPAALRMAAAAAQAAASTSSV